MKFIVLVIFLIVAFRSWAGLDEGIYVYQRGDFSAALREIQPLAERCVAKAQVGLCLIFVSVPKSRLEMRRPDRAWSFFFGEGEQR